MFSLFFCLKQRFFNNKKKKENKNKQGILKGIPKKRQQKSLSSFLKGTLTKKIRKDTDSTKKKTKKGNAQLKKKLFPVSKKEKKG